MPSEIILHEGPSSELSVRQSAIILCLAFSGDILDQWRATTPEDAIKLETAEQIPPRRLEKCIHEVALQEVRPDTIVVTALLDGHVVGIATWEPPEHYWRHESVPELLYRKSLEFEGMWWDWWFPVTWMKMDRQRSVVNARKENSKRDLGQGLPGTFWYLKTLAVHPKFQRKGVGSALVNWGMTQAHLGGEKIFSDASGPGRALYKKLGFNEVASFVLGDNQEVKVTCMLWDPQNS
jgi:GNAT superfamily N-acetyltransferase